MFVVYWLSNEQPDFQRFGEKDLSAALNFMNDLRAKQAAGEPVGFVAMSSELPNNVTKMGVADPPADYNWKKRRT
jgi:hypothetical protein